MLRHNGMLAHKLRVAIEYIFGYVKGAAMVQGLPLEREIDAMAASAETAGAGFKRRGYGAMRNRLGSHNGFTLVELIIAMALLVIGILAVISMQAVSLKSNTLAHQLSVATQLAQQALEDIMALDPGDPTINTAGTYAYSRFVVNPSASPVSYTNTLTLHGAGTYTVNYTTTIGNSTNGIPTGVTRVVAVVSFTNGQTVSITGFKRTV
jgi:prepilin-type N-terminal cleavage/methylation domain-containing protein